MPMDVSIQNLYSCSSNTYCQGNKTSDVLCKGGSTGSGIYTVSGNATSVHFVLTSGTLGTGTLTQSEIR
jgi:hypothetical protein